MNDGSWSRLCRQRVEGASEVIDRVSSSSSSVGGFGIVMPCVVVCSSD